MSAPIVLALSGASGAVYAVRLLETLLAAGRQVHLTISPAAVLVLKQELDLVVDLGAFEVRDLLPSRGTAKGEVRYHHHQDFMAPIASGSLPLWSLRSR